uniref:Uncharacterized protein n=1 Tax=Arundo donax TaxID=35708 RepID=A0A0A9CM16_ARUDO
MQMVPSFLLFHSILKKLLPSLSAIQWRYVHQELACEMEPSREVPGALNLILATAVLNRLNRQSKTASLHTLERLQQLLNCF